MKKVYLETSVVSYLAALPSRDLVVAAHQQITREWWESRRSAFGLFVSQLVIEEAGRGDKEAAARRRAVMEDLPLLETSSEVSALASTLVTRNAIPKDSAPDGLHVAIAAVHGIDYLLTWNMAHILNAELRPRIERVCRVEGFEPPVLCTAAELMGGTDVG